ncbi:glycogen/starch/alpha-glucan phosphorylase [Salisediminibacterium halotolerans]|uniref:Alpha-1,4 glucan phosphorylase n=1 Tax=Salisediminibacterium halotolerans TaxID=517425 RepID=A0A1H9UY63_9BACI|nr:glycogen/starch/alpha-glucan phosphorylase [Salisediminibacterium haloalkalitolerans]SES14271.1 starch phosphorylase [Salisediminibacterium haloalkalitolerans]
MHNYDPASFHTAIEGKLKRKHRTTLEEATDKEIYYSIASIIQDLVMPKWFETNQEIQQNKSKQVYYISMEFLIGRLIESNLQNCGLLDICNQTLLDLGRRPERIYEQEHDAALGNGGLGRLAACFLDSIASLGYAGHGSGIRYRYGLFEQRIIHGNQVELPDYWLKEEYPWETRKPDEAVEIRFGGTVHEHKRRDGSLEISYENTDSVMAVPYDVPVLGYHNEVVNTLRLWSAELSPAENKGLSASDQQYYHHLDHIHSIEQISGFLYPDDSTFEGKELRLKQQYFLVSATIKNIIANFRRNHDLPLSMMPEYTVIQINDTHPSLAVPELMRILMDEEGYGWEKAWQITTNLLAYTNHTTLSEALEKWPVSMIQNLLPRLYMIIHEINERFCEQIYTTHPELRDKIHELAIISYEQIHMAHLAIVGSFSVNGVAKIHTEILKNKEMKNFYTLYPKKFNNKTNGITHRRWLQQVNPCLASKITDVIGPRWVHEPHKLMNLLRYTNDAPFLETMKDCKQHSKHLLAKYVYEQQGVKLNTDSIFDVQIKRLHEYKRQLMNVFHIIYLYNELKDNPNMDITPRTFIFAAKAAPSYHLAKEVIKLIHHVASVVNNDPDIKDKLKVVFLENYNVSLAEKIIPAAEVSEQISTASKEASGTGNMKMMMNGAITCGTLDGANIEIRDFVGDDNIFIFGLTAEQVLDYYAHGGYDAKSIYHADVRVKRVLDQLNGGVFGSQEIEFKDLFYNIMYHNDPFFVLKDFGPYVETHEMIDRAYRDQNHWQRMAATNIAHSGKFSSDRTIMEYVSDIWKL